MSRSIRFSRLISMAGLTAFLLILGLVLDLGYARNQRQQVRLWQRQRADIHGQWAARENAWKEARGLADLLGAEDLPSALEALRRTDPVTSLARNMSESGLQRDELGTEGVSTSTERLRRTRFYLRARGSYGAALRFLKRLESGPLPVTIEDLLLQGVPESAELELRVHLSVYQPTGGRQ